MDLKSTGGWTLLSIQSGEAEGKRTIKGAAKPHRTDMSVGSPSLLDISTKKIPLRLGVDATG